MEKQSSIDITANLDNLAKVRLFIEETAQQFGVNSDTTYDLNFAVNELVTNTIIHGYNYKPGRIKIDMWQKNSAVYVRIKDQAPVFNPLTKPNPDMSQPLVARPVGGLGIFLTRQYVDEMKHTSPSDGGNEVLLIKRENSTES